MKSTKLKVAAVAVASALALAGCSSSGDSAGKELNIAMVSKGFQHQFWQAVKLGSENAATELGVKITFEGPES
jgi:ribose transport system substrate-binding protein